MVGQPVSQRANDQQEVEPALQEIEDHCDQLPDTLCLDNGDYSGSNLKAFSDRQVEAYVAVGRRRKTSPVSLGQSTRKVAKEDFRYDEPEDFFACPGGQKLIRVRTDQDGKRTDQRNSEACSA